MNVSVSIICPTYNEAGIAAKTLISLHTLVKKNIPEVKILVIDDGSTDENAAELQSAARNKPVIHISVQKENQGTARTLRTLYNSVQTPWCIVFSLDGEWDPNDVIRLYEEIKKNDADIIVGQRQIKQYTLGRKCVSFGYNFLNRFLFGVETYDAGSIKAIRKQIVRTIPITSTGVYDEAERIIRAQKKGYTVRSIPVHHLPTRKYPRAIPDISLVIEAFKDMFNVWYSLNFQS